MAGLVSLSIRTGVLAAACHRELTELIETSVVPLRAAEARIEKVFLARAGQALRSVGLLASSGLVGDAWAVARILFELHVDHETISGADSPLERFETYRQHSSHSRARSVHHVVKGSAPDLAVLRDQLVQEAGRSADEQWRNWNGKSLLARCQDLDRSRDNRPPDPGWVDAYMLYYAHCSSAAHSSHASLAYAAEMPPSNVWSVAPWGSDPDREPIGLACWFVIRDCQRTRSRLSMPDQPRAIEALLSDVLNHVVLESGSQGA